MPRFDGTGPVGKGPMTGRRLGNCAISESEFKKNLGKLGVSTPRGFRHGAGLGRGFGRRWQV